MNPLFLFRKEITPVQKLLLMHIAAGGKLIEQTATGNPLTFVTDVVKPFLAFELSMLPVQSGTGDPSPSNVRPISGWTGVTAYHSGEDTSNPTTYPVTFPALGKNLLDPATIQQGGIDADGTAFNSSKRVRSGYIPVEEGKKYITSAGAGTKAFMHFYNANKVSIGGNTSASSISPEGAAFMRCIIGYEDETNLVPSDITEGQVVQSNSSVPFEPYTSTCYGGTLDLVTGVLTATWAGISCTWADFTNKISMGDYTRGFYTLVNESVTGGVNGICNMAKRDWDYTTDKLHFYTHNTNCYLFLPDDTDASTSVQIAYPLKTPITYQLTPQQITALVGDNVIWSDTNDSNTAVYLKKG